MADTMLEGIRSNNHRVLSQSISDIENEHPLPNAFFRDIHRNSLDALRIGITGPPGAGKSTLTDQLIRRYTDDGKSVGVVAIDPTSPFTGGALLGDRVRMNTYSGNNNVFIRSMGSHGDLGGMARKAQDVGDVLAASGKDIIIFETVGVGQGEYDVAKAVDITCVVLVPESGDEIQMMKAGLIEIAELFIINKSDRQGAKRLAQVLSGMMHSTRTEREPQVVNTQANEGKGMDELAAAIQETLEAFEASGLLTEKRLKRYRSRVKALVHEELLKGFWTSAKMKELEKRTESIASLDVSPHEASQELLEKS